MDVIVTAVPARGFHVMKTLEIYFDFDLWSRQIYVADHGFILEPLAYFYPRFSRRQNHVERTGGVEVMLARHPHHAIAGLRRSVAQVIGTRYVRSCGCPAAWRIENAHAESHCVPDLSRQDDLSLHVLTGQEKAWLDESN